MTANSILLHCLFFSGRGKFLFSCTSGGTRVVTQCKLCRQKLHMCGLNTSGDVTVFDVALKMITRPK